jgi:hypothetical protein
MQEGEMIFSTKDTKGTKGEIAAENTESAEGYQGRLMIGGAWASGGRFGAVGVGSDWERDFYIDGVRGERKGEKGGKGVKYGVLSTE